MEHIYCACCGDEITGDYYMIGDNYLQTHYFDCDEDNVFCSVECMARFLSTLIVDFETKETYEY